MQILAFILMRVTESQVPGYLPIRGRKLGRDWLASVLCEEKMGKKIKNL